MHGLKAQHAVALLVAGLFQALAPVSQAAVLYDEGVSGDVLDGYDAELGVLAAGSNLLIGQLPDEDHDYYAFTIAPGYSLDAVIVDRLVPGPGESGPNVGSFIFRDPFNRDRAGALWTYNPAVQGLDLLEIETGVPVVPGNYRLMLYTGSGGQVDYRFNIQVSGGPEVPEASTVVAMAGLGLLGARRMWSHRRSATGSPVV